MSRRLLSLYFPGPALDRLERENPDRRLYPFAVTREHKGHLYIAAVNALARRAGIRVGARLADARTLLPELQVVPDDPRANARVKQGLIEWCNRYSPLVAGDGSGGIVLDISGCAHLFGGEAALLHDAESRIRKTGYRVRGAIADTPGAAWALARYGKNVIVTTADISAALDPLPVEALRLPREIIGELRRVGLDTIARIRKIPRQSLATRYGPGILLRLDQALGHAEEPITPYSAPAPYSVRRTLAEPVSTVSAVEYVLIDLLKEICGRLEKEHLGARRLDLACHRVDGTVATCAVSTSRPVRSVAHLMRLFSEKLCVLDAGFGIETLVLSVPALDRFDPAQLSLPQFGRDARGNDALDAFIDRIGMRLGFEEVCRFRIRESFLPGHAVEFRPVTAPPVQNAKWPEYRLRPIHLIDPPAPIEVMEKPTGELPAGFRPGRQWRHISKAEGPERLTPEWWRDAAPQWQFRDYYRIEDERGARFWIFREVNSGSASRWFLRGRFA